MISLMSSLSYYKAVVINFCSNKIFIRFKSTFLDYNFYIIGNIVDNFEKVKYLNQLRKKQKTILDRLN